MELSRSADANTTHESQQNLTRAEVSAENGEADVVNPSPICILCDPGHWSHRFFILIFICFLNFGNYLVYDSPTALASDFRKDMNITVHEYNLLYDVYSWPNVVLAFCAGVLVDRLLGVRFGGILFAFIVLLSQVIISVGAFLGIFWLMVLGRFVFAFGGESLGIVQNSYLVHWFTGKQLNLVFGVTLSFSRIGSTISVNVLKPIYESMSAYLHGNHCLGATLLISCSVCIFSVFCSLVLAYYDRRMEIYQKLMAENRRATTSDDGKSGTEQDKANVIQFRDILNLPLSLWLLCFICVTYYASVFPFIANAQEFYVTKFKFTEHEANLCNSLIYMLSVVLAPVFGIAIDLTGRNVYWMMVSLVLGLVAHVLLEFSSLTPYVAVILCGASYSMLAASLWPCVSYLVPRHVTATAFGVVAAIQNLGLGLVYLYIGLLLDHYGYFVLELHFIVSLSGILSWAILNYVGWVSLHSLNIRFYISVATVLSVVLFFVDRLRGTVVNKSCQQRRMVELAT